MSGGRLVVLDRLGREVKRYPLLSGLATLGSDPRCDIRVMLPTVTGHHATVVVHSNQTVVRNVGEGETLVNGVAISVAALRHGDLVTVGDRSLRWEYADPVGRKTPAAHPTLLVSRTPRARAARRGSGGAGPPPRSPTLQLALEMQHRASMPGNAGGKQVAIVQPQRRDTTEQNDASGRPSPAGKRQRSGAGAAAAEAPHATKAELWIQSRKTSPRRAAQPLSPAVHAPQPPAHHGRKPASAKKATPLRLAVLRRAQSVAKIRAPTAIDHTKQAAIMLMTGHTPKAKLPSPRTSGGKKTPSYVIKKHSPVRRTPRGSRGSKTPGSARAPKAGGTLRTSGARRSSKRGSGGHTLPPTEARLSSASKRSPPLPLPRKSALRDPASRASRKNDSIKFDLSNLTRYSDGLDDATPGSYDASATDEDLSLRYSDSSTQSPSPRRSAHSRSSRMLEQTLGASPSPRPTPTAATPDSPRRKSGRGSLIVQKALDASDGSRYSRRSRSPSDSAASAAATPRSPRHLETYSIVDLVSIDSSDSRSTSVYNSANSSAIAFGTPQNSLGRKTRSTIDPSTLIGSSTPYVGKGNSTRNSSKSSIDSRRTTRGPGVSRRSKSLSTPENTQMHISVNSTRISRASKSRSRINDSDLMLITSSDVSQLEDESPRSSRRVSRSSQESQDSPVLSRKTRSNEGSPMVNLSKSNQGSPVIRGRGSKSNQSSPVIGRASKASPVIGRVSKSSPVIGRVSKSSPVIGRVSKSSPVIGRASKSSPVIGRASKSSPVIGRASRSNQSSPVIARSSTSNQSSPVIGRRSKSNEASPAIGRSSRASESSPVLVSRKTKSSQPISSPAPKRKSSRRSGGDTTPSNEGVSTPENRHSPEEVGTPMLSIQTLLDSSQSSLTSLSSRKGRASINIKRKTIGAIRSETRRRTGHKSKSLNFTARKGLLRMSKDSDDDVAKSNEKMVTPKSAVKLVQEAVKNKHSTAKKPFSKRSIIDNLDESDIVKQLFNSPVKRKLSQSMTEFSRKQLFDDDEAPRRPTRNTIAFTARTPENSILDHTEAFTPEVFVSPISTPSNSPNLAGIKRLFRKDTPQNDLRNVRGVKALLKTPRARRSVRNDLTNVSGVKQVFAKSPRNRLSDVRVKEVFAASPKDDLRRVSGVKTLFRSQKERKSPRNDLSDVRGVRNLFKRGSPANDLRRVSGVKRALQKGSPRNDLRDVRGVKGTFKRRSGRDDLNDVSGVEELFNESGQSARDDSAFDRLIGKPTIKAVYSNSFVKKPAPKSKGRRGKSLHASIDVTSANVEQWLEQELQKRLQDSRARELRNLTTETVDGAHPVRTSRRSGAEVTLPFKKRSLADGDASVGSGAGAGASVGRSLPIKKRMVVHSTPVKGRGRAAAAPELGRVSPIALTDTSIRSEPSTLLMSELTVMKGRRSTKVAIEGEKPSPKASRASPMAKTSPNKSKPSPRNTRPSARSSKVSPKSAKPSPRSAKPSPRTSILSPLASKPSARTSKLSPSLSKQSPRTAKTPASVDKPSPRSAKTSPRTAKLSPRAGKPSPKVVETSPRTTKPSPRTTIPSPRTTKPSPRTTKPSPRTTKPSPKKTKPSPKATKPSPKTAKPARTTKSSAKVAETSIKAVASPNKAATPQQRSTRARGNKANVSQNNTKRLRTSLVITKKSPIMTPKPAPRSRRGKAEEATKVVPVDVPKATPKKTRATRKQDEKPATPKTPKRNTRAKVQKASVVVSKPSPQLKPQARTRTKVAEPKTKAKPETKVSKTETKVSEPKTRGKRESKAKENEAPRRGRKTTAGEKTIEEVESRSKRRKVESPKKSPGVTSVVENEPKGRRNKSSVAKSPERKWGRKTQEVVETEPKRNTRKTQVKDSKAEAGKEQPKGTRARKPLESQASTQSEPVRGRRARAATDTSLPATAPTHARKRKTSADPPTPAKLPKLAAKGRKTTATAASPPAAGRGRRAAQADTKTAKKEAAKETVPKTNSRKKKTEAEPTPVKKVAGKKSPKKSPAATRTRKAAAAAIVATKTTGRSRRR